MKNMKIEINESQSVGDVVRELERLGFKRYYCNNKKVSCICTYTTNYYNCYSTNKNQFNGEITTLSDLRKMERVE